MIDAQATSKFKHNVGDFVRVNHECTYFDPSIMGVGMKIVRVEPIKVDGKMVVMYHTDKPDPILAAPFNEDELVAGVTPPPRISAKWMD